MKTEAWIPLDHEVYCFLKYHLPANYSIESEPSTSYFSESQFCYRVFDAEDQEIRRLSGTFDDLAPGSLVHEAQKLLEELRTK